MKKKIILFLLFLNLSYANAQELVWHTDANNAITESNRKNKPLLLFFTGSDWCGWCIRLQKEVFKQPEFAKWAKDNVVLLELDFPRKTSQPENIRNQNFQIQQVFGVRGYPTIWFVNAQLDNQKVNFAKLGSIGYVAGGPEKWLESAKTILANKK